MAVLSRMIVAPATPDAVRKVLISVERIPDYTQVASVRDASAKELAAGATWKNRGATLKLPSWDSSRVTEVTADRIAWHTRSMVLGIIPVGADWSYTIKPAQGGTEVTNTFERVSMFGLPVGALIKAPFLPMLYLARGAMMAGEKKLAQTLAAAGS
jgi:hypothetical protein